MPRVRRNYNVILTRLYIDGIPASRTTLYDIEKHGVTIFDQVDVRFDVGSIHDARDVELKSLRRFRFTKASVTDLENGEGESGTIHLRVKVGERVPPASGRN